MARCARALAAMAGAVLALACTGRHSLGSGSVAGGAASAKPPASAAQPDFVALERDVLEELNAARTDPTAYARRLDALLPLYDGRVLRRPGQVGLTTEEGAAAVREASAALRATSARRALTRSSGMSQAARDHARDQGRTGALGHTGSDGSDAAARVNRYGRWQTRITESNAYGFATGADVVQQLIIDDAVPGRGHRRNLLDTAVAVTGVGCAAHLRYRVVCVIDLAAGYEER